MATWDCFSPGFCQGAPSPTPCPVRPVSQVHVHDDGLKTIPCPVPPAASSGLPASSRTPEDSMLGTHELVPLSNWIGLPACWPCIRCRCFGSRDEGAACSCCVCSWDTAEDAVDHVTWAPFVSCEQRTGGWLLEAGSVGRDGRYMHRDQAHGAGLGRGGDRRWGHGPEATWLPERNRGPQSATEGDRKP